MTDSSAWASGNALSVSIEDNKEPVTARKLLMFVGSKKLCIFALTNLIRLLINFLFRLALLMRLAPRPRILIFKDIFAYDTTS